MTARTAPRARTYRVVLHREPASTGWWVSVPALPGCFTQGAMRAPARERVREAIEAHIAGLLADGEPVPEDSAVEMDAVEVEA
jgi:predicted RNase H-like HicB family nuclease